MIAFWRFGTWDLGFRRKRVRNFANNLPGPPEMFLSRQYVADTDAHYCSAAQFRLCEICPPGRIDSLNHVAV